MGKLKIPDWMRPVVIVVMALVMAVVIIASAEWSLPVRLLAGLGVGILVAIVLDSIIEKR